MDITNEQPSLLSQVPVNSVVEKVITEIKEMILNKKLNIGDKLLPEREMAKRLNVSRSSVREAIRILSIYGVLEVIPGSGTYICDPKVDSFADFLELSLALKLSFGENLHEIRSVLEIGAIRLATIRATEAELSELHQQILLMSDSSTFKTIGAEADFNFHRIIIKSAHNELLDFLYHGIEGLLHKTHYKLRNEAAIVLKDNYQVILKSHKEIFEFLVKRDALNAERAMREHFEVIQKKNREFYFSTNSE